MASTLAWRPLPLPRSPGVPVLLASLDVGTADYTIHVTDMANMWTESLDRKAICMRGWSENTTIDPSDTAENMTKFLTSLKSALDSSQRDHDQTSLSVSPASTADSGGDGLALNITCQLPGLGPLKWPMHLKKSPSSAIATDFVLPLVQAHHVKTQEVESLVQFLSYKDSVITKLLDKLEATGTSLEHVFTSLSGRKKVTRAVAEEKVRGLAPFNKSKWKANLEDNQDGRDSAGDLVQGVFGGDGLQYQTLMDIDESPGLDRWWHDFEGMSHIPHRTQREKTPPKTRTPSPPAQPQNVDDDDFQVQSTPPHLTSPRKRRVTRNPLQLDDASTEDEETSFIPDTHTPAVVLETQPLAGSTKPASRLGTIGRKKELAPAPSPTPKTSPAVVKTSAQVVDDSETASDTDDDEATASLPDDSPPRPPQSAAAGPPKKGGFGRIGGQKPEPAAYKPETPETGHAAVTETADAAARPKKLGVIGKKVGGATSSSLNDTLDPIAERGRNVARGKGEVKGEVKEQPRETSQERADRKREELKRDLERKAAAGPAKKKRKF